MLDADTKRRIDTARDILVGKVPDPKSQVEQITIALIYKFMDDIDAESEELGGKRQFFADGFARYGWANLMRPGLGGHETLNLYADAITRMPENPGIPPLFRDIFNNAYLPYRDPETLRAFLKIINEFSYDHSERLGDAFEYLLSVLGSQGDAGQFRTPRHIIDFIVAVVDPKKDDVVIDPACGTAGFLISSYKHILAANTDNDGSSTLTPDDRRRLAVNFKGYDISPDMVRLSLVNMYLHGFVAPQIHEYDTLTSDERWNEYADVILANPPFMSPKGGIRPHNRFSVKSKRSEVLFVDYMAEHLTPTGRAGIIVPEGIIFQSQKAHTALRKMLVDEYLVAVVSLPAGVFNPYSGVKTSILILDKALARRTDRIAFFKVEADGFDLGAQRRAVDRSDLPQVQAELAEYLNRLRASASLDDFAPNMGLVVEKDRVATDGDYNLSGERYRATRRIAGNFPLVPIGDVCLVNPRFSQQPGLDLDPKVSFVPMADLNEHQMGFQPKLEKNLSAISTSHSYFEDDDVLLARVTPCFENGKAGVARGLTNGIGFGSSEFYVLRPQEHILSEWLYFCATHPEFRDLAKAQMTGTGGLQRVPRRFVKTFQIPLPPLEVQEEVIAEINGYQRVIDGARAVVENYRPHIAFDPDWPEVALGDVAELIRGITFRKADQLERETNDSLRVATTKAAQESGIVNDALYHIPRSLLKDERKLLRPGDILISTANSLRLLGRTTHVKDVRFPTSFGAFMSVVRPNNKILDSYLISCMRTPKAHDFFLKYANTTTNISNLNLSKLADLLVPLPSTAIQESIVAELEAEQALVEANRQLIERMEKKIQAAIGRVWG